MSLIRRCAMIAAPEGNLQRRASRLNTRKGGPVIKGERIDTAKTEVANRPEAARTFASGRCVATRLLGEGGQITKATSAARAR
jgi:hypothetical protein